MVSAKVIIQGQANKIFDYVLDNNRKIYWNFLLLRGIISGDRMENTHRDN